VAVAGDSTVFGWGVADPARRFPDRLADMLAGAGLQAQVFNFGQSGYSTVQGRRLLQAEILPLEPDVVVLLYGANDYGAASGRTDARQPVAGSGGGVARAQGWLRRSALYRRLAGALVRARDAATAGTGDGPAAGGTLRRVPLPELAANLEAMVAAARSAGATPVLMTYPRRPLHPILPCPLPPPGDRSALARWQAAIRELAAALEPAVAAVRAAPATPAGAALGAWDRLPSAIRQGPSGLYGEAWIRQRAGDTATADRLLTAAAEAAAPGECALDLFSLRAFRYLEEPAARATNRVIRQVAAGSGVALVDAADLLAKAQQALLSPDPGEATAPTRILGRWFGPDSYFVDVVHPSARGHALLAESLSGPVLDALRR
jgi:lysophospholipase L1-like esterase